jgi:hypothetical protein
MARRARVCGLLLVGTACSAIAASAGQASREAVPAAHVYLFDMVARAVVARAIEGAARRLDRPACLLVLTDFSDATGQPLLEALAATGRPAADYLVERIWFVDGDTAVQCRNDVGIAAFTAADSKVVHICAAHFVALTRRSAVGEMLVIHELLHTLGLGENPPGSKEITQRVTNRCGGG